MKAGRSATPTAGPFVAPTWAAFMDVGAALGAGAAGMLATLAVFGALGAEPAPEPEATRDEARPALVVEAREELEPERAPTPVEAAAAADAFAPTMNDAALAPLADTLEPAPGPAGAGVLGAAAGPAGSGMSVYRGAFDGPRLGAGRGPGASGGGQLATPPQKAKARYRPTPRYPASARQRGVEGEVVVRMRVDARGRVIDVAIVRSNPPGVFDDAARQAARAYRFDPAVQGGQAVESTVEQRIAFKLRR